jgi:hypothetical protein
MSQSNDINSLANLTYIPYLDDLGYLPPDLEGKIGVYAVFDADQVLQFIGYSRDIFLSIKQHLARCPQQCYWLKVEIITKPSRTILDTIKAAWIEENGGIPPGNLEEAKWQDPIDTRPAMTEADQEQYKKSDGLGQLKLIKNVARRVEAEILVQLQARGVKEEMRFNPKLKESGLLDLK